MDKILDFNNREIAILLWIAIFLSYCLTNKTIKDGFSDILKACKPVSIWGPLLVGSLWISMLVIVLQKLKIWDWGNLKTTVIWTFTFAFYSMIQAMKIEFDGTYRRQLALESFGLAAILMFIGSIYTLPLWAEFLVLPFAFSLSAMQIISSRKPEFTSAHKLVTYVLNILGFTYISYWVYSVSQNPQRLLTLTNLEDFLMPIFLTIWYLPYLYLWKLVMVYELLFVALERNIQDPKLLRFSKLMAVWRLKWSLNGIDQFKKRISIRTLTNKYEVIKQLQWVKLLALKEKYLTEDTPSGWAPKNAMSFLAGDDLRVKSYAEPSDNEWHGSAFKKLKSEDLFKSFNYCIDGNETQVRSLKLTMSVWGTKDIPASETEFLDLGARLMISAIKVLPIGFIRRLSSFEEFEGNHEFVTYKFSIIQCEGPKHTVFEYKLELHITESDNSVS